MAGNVLIFTCIDESRIQQVREGGILAPDIKITLAENVFDVCTNGAIVVIDENHIFDENGDLFGDTYLYKDDFGLGWPSFTPTNNGYFKPTTSGVPLYPFSLISEFPKLADKRYSTSEALDIISDSIRDFQSAIRDSEIKSRDDIKLKLIKRIFSLKEIKKSLNSVVDVETSKEEGLRLLRRVNKFLDNLAQSAANYGHSVSSESELMNLVDRIIREGDGLGEYTEEQVKNEFFRLVKKKTSAISGFSVGKLGAESIKLILPRSEVELKNMGYTSYLDVYDLITSKLKIKHRFKKEGFTLGKFGE